MPVPKTGRWCAGCGGPSGKCACDPLPSRSGVRELPYGKGLVRPEQAQVQRLTYEEAERQGEGKEDTTTPAG